MDERKPRRAWGLIGMVRGEAGSAGLGRGVNMVISDRNIGVLQGKLLEEK